MTNTELIASNTLMRKTLFTILILLIPIATIAGPKSAYVWAKLAEGFFYATYSFSVDGLQGPSIHAFLIDPKKFRIGVAMAPNESEGSTASEMARREKAVLVINGGFFTPEHKSIGLIIKDGKELNPIHRTSWWSIFAMNGDKPGIFTPREFKATPEIKTALQVGPRLAIDGNIPKLKESISARSAVGITRDGKIIIAITHGGAITMTELAHRMSASRFEGGLECPNAMALDGGSSSQIYAKVKRFELSLPGLVRVTNGLAVFAK